MTRVGGLGALAMSVLAAASTGACAPEGRPAAAVERVDSAGVSIVTSPGTDTPLDWTTERVFALGGAEEGAEGFYDVEAVARGPDDGLYVLDREGRRVVRFGPEGEFIWTAGREGEGPGEFRSPAHIAVAPDGSATVYDRRALVRFGPEGGPRGRTRSDLDPWASQYAPLAAPYLRDLGESGGLVARGRSTISTTVALVRTKDGAPDTLTSVRLEPLSFTRITCSSVIEGDAQAMTIAMDAAPPIFLPLPWWDAAAGRIFVASGAAYSVEVFGDDGVEAIIRRDLPVRTAGAQEADREMRRFLRRWGDCSTTPADLVDQLGFADQVPWISYLTALPDGSLWVRRNLLDEPHLIDVFDPGGAYLGTLPPDFPYPVVFLSADRFVTTERDEYDIQRVIVNRIVR